jgi:hypothetical protein
MYLLFLFGCIQIHRTCQDRYLVGPAEFELITNNFRGKGPLEITSVGE